MICICKINSKLQTITEKSQSVFLLVIRLYWGFGFAQSGWGKYMNMERTIGFFESIGIPFPAINAAMSAGVELFGGILLILGLGSKLVPIPLIVTMIVAYATAHKEELGSIFSDTDKFIGAPPFLFLYASLIIWLFGAGFFSLDQLLSNKSCHCKSMN